MKRYLLLLLIGFCFLSVDQANAQKKKKNQSKEGTEEKKKDSNGVKPYKDIITEEAVSDEGLFTVHKVNDKYYFEIPDSLINREILIVSRIAGTIEGFNFGGAGMKARSQQTLRWELKENMLVLRYVSYSSVADETQPIYKSVRNNNFEPVIETFPLKAYSADSTAYVIEVNEFFTKDIPMLGPLRQSQRKDFGVKSLDKDRTFIEGMKSFPLNVEVKHVLTFSATKLPSNSNSESLSILMNQSMVLLPKEPWSARMYDERVGYFSIEQFDYGLDEQKAAERRYITRWRLDPSDPEAFSRGELVEPKKPIEYYIDPATPEKWRKYIKQGVEDWNVAFEEAGFKNAIRALDPPSPEEDPDWSPEDVRYSVIRYVTNPIQNAQGPHVHDPRSGEIIESDIIWYHNIMNLLRNWYFIQTSAVNEEAQATKFKDEVMGELIRFVSAHEVGHTLGLPHNMGSSPGYPVDSLRSPSFTATHGTAPSIMDYARFNYIAQPGDGVTSFFPAIGEYDIHSIKWGYRPILEAGSPEEEKPTLHSWIMEHENDPMYRFGRQQRAVIDPSSQTEDLGDDPVYASNMGIENLKRIIPNLRGWTSEEGKDYSDLDELYGQAVSQYSRYMGHVSNNIGGIYGYYKTSDQEGAVYTHVPKSRQKEAMSFLNEQLFNTPDWMIDKSILTRIESSGIQERIRSVQVRTLNSVLEFGRLARISENETLNGDNAYSMIEMMNDLQSGVWTELRSGRSIDSYRRNLQKAYIDRMEYLITEEQSENAERRRDTMVDASQSDIRSAAKGQLRTLRSEIRSAIPRMSDTMSKYHLQDVNDRIEMILDPR